jgi:beta-glucosidase
MKNFVAIVGLLVSLIAFSSCQKNEKNKKDPSYHFTMKSDSAVTQKVDSLLQQLTLKEKIRLLGGTGFTTKPIPRLGIPALKMVDGPLGVRSSEIKKKPHWPATAFPSGTAIAASWDTSLVYKEAEAIGTEMRGEGQDVILGPNVNIARNPKAGRTFEGFGEDPFLTSRMGVNYIKGLQSQGVAATVKHFVVYTEEYHRMKIDSKVKPLALHEIYFPAFKAAIQQAHTLALMSSYNKVNGDYVSDSHYLLTQILRKKWGYKNLVMSDWGGVYDTMPAETSGVDLEMPTGKYFNDSTITPLLKAGKVSKKHINQQVRHILRVIVSLNLINHPHKKDSTLVDNASQRKLARKAVREGIVLLKNTNHLLPLDLSKIDTLLVTGPAAKHVMRGGGSSLVPQPDQVSPWEALKKRIGDKVDLKYVPGVITNMQTPALSGDQLHTSFHGGQNGLKAEYFTNNKFQGKPAIIRVDTVVHFGGNGIPVKSIKNSFPKAKADSLFKLFKKGFSMRWTGSVSAPKTGDYDISVADNNGMRFFFNGKQVMQEKTRYGIASNHYKVHLKAGKKYPIRLEYYFRGSGMNIKLGMHPSNKELIQKAAKAAKSSDLALVFVGFNQNEVSEGHDIKSLKLPDGQGKLIEAVAKANSKTVVSLSAGMPVVMEPWNKQAGALLDAWFGGEETGNALVDVLTGKYNPAGKLPLTFPKRWKDSPAAKTYKKNDGVAVHQEGIYVGYRYFDEHHVNPEYPFGYGLSYTTFSFSDIKAQKQDSVVDVTFTIKNTGSRAGHEVAQLYIHKENSAVKRAPHALKGFARVKLSKGQSKTVHINVPRQRFAYYNLDQKKWMVEPGSYTILVGPSSRKLPLKTTISW